MLICHPNPTHHLPRKACYSHHSLLSSLVFRNCFKPGSKAAASPLEVCPDMGTSFPVAHKPWVLTAQEDQKPAGLELRSSFLSCLVHRYSHSSPQCSGSAAQIHHTGPQAWEEGVPGAGGLTW